jgi:hypothetical protein
VIYANELTPEEAITLNEMHKNHPLHVSRKRAHSILLSHQDMSVPHGCFRINPYVDSPCVNNKFAQ